MRIKLTTAFPDWPLIRQTPKGLGVWGDVRFFINTPVDECDAWVVYEGLSESETTRCPEGNTLLVTGEPPSIRRYGLEFTSQFGHVATCHGDIEHPNRLLHQQALPWHVGVTRKRARVGGIAYESHLDYDALAALPPPRKAGLVSVVCSDKQVTGDQVQRVRFAEALQRRLGSRVDRFGFGSREVDDKWSAIAGYHFHIVLENSSVPHYWTEKLADAYLGWAFPFYWGAPNLRHDLPVDSYIPIDIYDIDRSIDTIEKTVAEFVPSDLIARIRPARMRILNEHNLFPVLARLCQQMTPGPRRLTRLYAERRSGLLRGFAQDAARALLGRRRRSISG